MYEYCNIIFYKDSNILASLKQTEQQQYSSSSSEGKIIQKRNIGYAIALGWVWQHSACGYILFRGQVASSAFTSFTHRTS
jgi:hypothetical protein